MLHDVKLVGSQSREEHRGGARGPAPERGPSARTGTGHRRPGHVVKRANGCSLDTGDPDLRKQQVGQRPA